MFAKLPQPQIQWLVAQGRDIHLEPGEIHRHEGAPADCIFVLLSGQVRVYQGTGTRELVLATYKTRELFGELPVLTGEARFWASGRAIVPSHIFELPKAAFWQLLARCPSVAMQVLGTMARRMQDVQSLYQQQEKLAALGTLAAGLAHEMNNPATAALRGAQDLGQILPALAAYATQPLSLTSAQQQHVAALQQAATQHAPTTADLDPMSQCDREDALGAWLEGQADAEAWKLAPALNSARLEVAQLAPLAAQFSSSHELGAVLQWLALSQTGAEALQTIQAGARRICELVAAIKDYSFMDRAPVQTVDIHAGLENTLTILSYRLKQGNIAVRRDYNSSLPCIQAYGSELNQVWTHLLDNAIDGLVGQPDPAIELRTRQEGDRLRVEVLDNGPGIPPEIQPRIFEPFFTTKAVGAGTGLGLDATYRIVRKHGGDIYFTSQPGTTCFYVRLPVGEAIA